MTKKLLSLFRSHWHVLLLLLFWGLLFFNLLSTHMLRQEADGLYSGGSTWGDLAVHATLLESFRHRGISATLASSPIYSATRLHYPFIPDLASAFLAKLGLSIQSSLIIPSILLLLVVVLLLYVLARSMGVGQWGAFAVPFLFFLNGSIAGLSYFWQDMRQSGIGFWYFLFQMQKQYAHLTDHNIHFSNLIADYILPQRGIIWGFALGIIALIYLWKYWESGKKHTLLYAGLAVGLLPLIHTHTFVTMLMVAGFLSLIHFFSSIKHPFSVIRDWLYFFVSACAIGLPQFFWLSPGSTSSFLQLQWGWMKGDEGFLLFWIRNLGFYIPLIVAGYCIASKQLKSFYLAFVLIFLTANMILFQPFVFDNMKFMVYWFLVSTVLMAGLIDYAARKMGRASIWIVIPLLFATIAVGGLSTLRESYVHWRFLSNEDMALAQYVNEHTPVDALFLTSDKHNHPIPTLAGRGIVMGYRGWLWTYGINYSKREQDIFAMYAGGPAALSLITRYGVRYILFERDKVNDFHINQQFLDNNFHLVYESANYRLYEVSGDGE